MVDWIGLLVPVAYLSILIGSFATFSYLYRKRKATRAANLEPWFPPHLQRNVYLSLLHMDPSDPASAPADAEKSLKQVPDSIVKAALLRRAVEDIHRIIQIRNAKPALQALVQRGSVGDELWQRFLRAEQDIEEEVKDVVNEVSILSFTYLVSTNVLDVQTLTPIRQTHSPRNGANSSSNPPTRSPTTSSPKRAWRRCRPRSLTRRNGGTCARRVSQRGS